MQQKWPHVSVIMPVRDEAGTLEDAVAAVLGQDYAGEIELVVALAPSSDGTTDLLGRIADNDCRVRVIGNPAGSTPAGLNAAIAASRGSIVVRVDGHSLLRPDYVRRAVSTLYETGADNVGGVQRAVGATPMQRAIAAAMTSRFGVGDAAFHFGGSAGPTDTVYLGVFRRDALERVGGFDESLVRNQDYELNWRIRASGGVVWFDPQLEVTYRPRQTLRALAKQYHDYGRWKRVVVERDPASVRWRQLVPPLTLIANAVALLLSPKDPRLLLTPAVYVLGAVAAAATARESWSIRLRLPAVFAVMHHAWGAGFLRGVRDAPTARPGLHPTDTSPVEPPRS